MSWIAVHDEVLGGKLRGFRKKLKCSEAEALGILTYLWLWARKNADRDGLLTNVDKEDIANIIRPIASDNINFREAVDSLIESGWLDENNGCIYVHDWYEWQSYWYAYLDKKKKDKIRKQLSRENAKKNAALPEKPKKVEKAKPEKIEYAESVKLLQSEYNKLVEDYGEELTKKCIEKLNNYKLSKGAKYKSDYRAILSWVVEKCEKEYPRLKKTQTAQAEILTDNPFEEY